MSDRCFARFAQSDPSRAAVVEPLGRCWSRSELFGKSNQIAHVLRSRGIASGDVVAILSPNCVDFVAAYLGATDIGAYVVPINWHLSPTEVVHILTNSGTRVLFAHERLAPMVAKLADNGYRPRGRGIAFGRLPGFESLAELTANAPLERVEAPAIGRMLVYTSATTGRPKAVQLPLSDSAQSRSRTVAYYNHCGIRAEESNVHLCASMLYHAGPLDCAIMALHMGHKVILVDTWESEQLLRLIQQYRVTTSFMVPSMFVRLTKLPANIRERYDVSSLRLVIHSAAPCPLQTKRQLLDWWGPVLWEGYGAAEGAGTAVSPQEWLQRPGTVGRPIPGSELRVLDDEGLELPPGKVGTIYFTRYTGDRFEYKDEPAATQAAYRGELFTVGDLGYVDEAGYLFLCDRKIDLVICGGLNIYPAEIEQILVQHPQVVDCAVFGVPDESLGEALQAVVQPLCPLEAAAGLTNEITTFLLRHLSVIKIPRRFAYVPQLPRDPSGKLYKRLLREQYAARAASGPQATSAST